MPVSSDKPERVYVTLHPKAIATLDKLCARDLSTRSSLITRLLLQADGQIPSPGATAHNPATRGRGRPSQQAQVDALHPHIAANTARLPGPYAKPALVMRDGVVVPERAWPHMRVWSKNYMAEQDAAILSTKLSWVATGHDVYDGFNDWDGTHQYFIGEPPTRDEVAITHTAPARWKAAPIDQDTKDPHERIRLQLRQVWIHNQYGMNFPFDVLRAPDSDPWYPGLWPDEVLDEITGEPVFDALGYRVDVLKDMGRLPLIPDRQLMAEMPD